MANNDTKSNVEKAQNDMKANVEKAKDQFQSAFSGPARSYANMMLDYTEKLANVQRDSLNVYSELAFKQVRSALEVKSAEDLRNYAEEQQKAAKEASEQMKADAEKVVSINKEFMQQSQEVTQDSMKRSQEMAKENMEQGKQKLEEVTKQGQQKFEEAANRGEQQVKENEKDAKSASATSSSKK